MTRFKTITIAFCTLLLAGTVTASSAKRITPSAHKCVVKTDRRALEYKGGHHDEPLVSVSLQLKDIWYTPHGNQSDPYEDGDAIDSYVFNVVVNATGVDGGSGGVPTGKQVTIPTAGFDLGGWP